jgi:CheY-like chemotaxis protein
MRVFTSLPEPLRVKENTCETDMPDRPLTVQTRQPLAGIRILAADDEPFNQIVLEDLLGDLGASLTCVSNGQQAVEAVERSGKEAWDIVLMDIRMPVMDGHAATRRLRELAPDLPIIALSAHDAERAQESCLASGMLEHIGKPFELEHLLAAIQRHCRRWSAT